MGSAVLYKHKLSKSLTSTRIFFMYIFPLANYVPSFEFQTLVWFPLEYSKLGNLLVKYIIHSLTKYFNLLRYNQFSHLLYVILHLIFPRIASILQSVYNGSCV